MESIIEKVNNEKKQMTNDECRALVDKLRANIHHRCQAVPFNTAEWVNGYIAGIIHDKRSGKIIYAIKTDDGRKIIKVWDSKLLKIFDEMVTPARKSRARKEKFVWSEEAIAVETDKVIGNVGKIVHIGNEQGRITAIVCDKRNLHLLYRIAISDKSNPDTTRNVVKVVTAKELQIAEKFDAEGLALNLKYCARRKNAYRFLTPHDRVIRCKSDLAKAEEQLKKAAGEVEIRKQRLKDAEMELGVYLEEGLA